MRRNRQFSLVNTRGQSPTCNPGKLWFVKSIMVLELWKRLYSCFDHSDFPAHSMFTFDVCWDSLGTSIFGNSSSATNNIRSRLPSRLSFRFLWLWFVIVDFVVHVIFYWYNYRYWCQNVLELAKNYLANTKAKQIRIRVSLKYSISYFVSLNVCQE